MDIDHYLNGENFIAHDLDFDVRSHRKFDKFLVLIGRNFEQGGQHDALARVEGGSHFADLKQKFGYFVVYL